MAKFKPARGRKPAPAAGRPQAIGCVIVLLALFAFVYMVMYYAIKQG
jgi:hypothetical protein